MAVNKRGFIGIFSQDSSSGDPVDDMPALTRAKEGRANGSELPSARDESDWDDVFDEAGPGYGKKSVPTSDSEQHDRPVNPVAASMARNATPQADSDSKPDSNSDTGKEAPEETVPTDQSTRDDGRSLAALSSEASPAYPFSNKQSSHPIMETGTSPQTAQLSADDQQLVREAIKTIQDKLSFARKEAPGAEGNLMNLGETGRKFVDEAVVAVRDQPDLLPRSFDDASFVADFETTEALRKIGADLDELRKRIGDTESRIAARAFAGAQVVHRSANLPGDDPYHRASSKTPSTSATSPQSGASATATATGGSYA